MVVATYDKLVGRIYELIRTESFQSQAQAIIDLATTNRKELELISSSAKEAANVTKRQTLIALLIAFAAWVAILSSKG